MKATPLILTFAFAVLLAPAGIAQEPDDSASSRVDAATAYTFSGNVIFRQKGSNVIYDLTVTDGQVSGYQYWPGNSKPIGRIVGGWFDFDRRRLSILVQGEDDLQARLLIQMQQFHLDLNTREVTLEHLLFGFGLTLDNTSFNTAHVLMVLDRVTPHVEHLIK